MIGIPLEKPRASIVIPTFCRRDSLEQVIIAVENQTVPRPQYEVIVCGTSTSDGTAELMSSLITTYPNLSYIELSNNAAAPKRNAGVQAARADIIIFLDDDVMPGPGLVSAHLKAHSDREDQFICGMVSFPDDWVSNSNYFRFRNSRYLGLSRPEVDLEDIPYQMIVSMNGSIRRDDVLNRVGLMSEEFERYGGEDYEFGYRITRAGLRIRFAPDAIAEHREPGGSIRQWMNKLYVTARHSLPVLYRLAPGSSETTLARLLEPPNGEERWRLRLVQTLMRIALHQRAVGAAERFLQSTDRRRWCYSPLLFQYAFAGATLRGILERERVIEPVPVRKPLTQYTGTGGLK